MLPKGDTVISQESSIQIFPGGSDGKEFACIAEDPSSVSGSGRSHGEGNGNLIQYSCLENPMDRGVLWAVVHWCHKESDMTK